MPDIYGPPAPLKPEPAWNELRHAITKRIPRHLNNARSGLRKMRHRRRVG